MNKVYSGDNLQVLREHIASELLTIEGLLNSTQRAEHPEYKTDLNFEKEGESNGRAAAADLRSKDEPIRHAPLARNSLPVQPKP